MSYTRAKSDTLPNSNDPNGDFRKKKDLEQSIWLSFMFQFTRLTFDWLKIFINSVKKINQKVLPIVFLVFQFLCVGSSLKYSLNWSLTASSYWLNIHSSTRTANLPFATQAKLLITSKASIFLFSQSSKETICHSGSGSDRKGSFASWVPSPPGSFSFPCWCFASLPGIWSRTSFDTCRRP